MFLLDFPQDDVEPICGILGFDAQDWIHRNPSQLLSPTMHQSLLRPPRRHSVKRGSEEVLVQEGTQSSAADWEGSTCFGFL